MKIISIPCLKDNYAYLVICPKTNEAAVVDPSEFGPVQKVLEKTGVKLTTILNTHHHWDHVGGNLELAKAYPGIKVFGGVLDRGRVPGQTDFLDNKEKVKVGSLEGFILFNPGHTSGAITYVFGGHAFTGDTLFAAGCGRLFEGTPKEMYNSLNEVIGSLPKKTQIYFGHEYTVNNLKFAMTVDPENSKVKEKLKWAEEKRKKGEFTTPSTLESEWETNPFMRCSSEGIKKFLTEEGLPGATDPVLVFKEIRERKDRF